ncbi:MAG: L-seryl-tRNA(Sec) selenium transferase [FCB group bacterium]|nr:L-seryl-tRNA(Sec) selenium transferase [FCB group bacterium]
MKNRPSSLKTIPAVDELLFHLQPEKYSAPYALVLRTIRTAVKQVRQELLKGKEIADVPAYTRALAGKLLNTVTRSSLRGVINGTGIVLHTGLGRAPISEKLVDRVRDRISGYSNVELDIRTGKRGERIQHVEALLCTLTGAESAVVVNNNAAAVLIMLNSIAENKEVIISRGQQVEIGGSFRIPDVIRKSGCIMKEIGTTNKTHLRDYSAAVTPQTGAILVAHTSNYKIKGFTSEVPLSELAELARKRRIPLLLDLGSGAIADLVSLGLPDEPVVSRFIRRGAQAVTFSGDKLLGGPQAGIICGKKTLLRKIRDNALYRALRCDKITYALLEETLRTYHDSKEISSTNLALHLLTRSPQQLKTMGVTVTDKLPVKLLETYRIRLVETQVEAGSGSLPTEFIPSVALEMVEPTGKPAQLAAKFRHASVPVIGYIHGNKFRIDLKAIDEGETGLLISLLTEVLS